MNSIQKKRATSPWSLTYQFKTAEFGGYLDGTKKLSYDDVLWNAPNEPRTDKNFPVVPTAINQKIHTIALGYQFSNQWQGLVSIPYIQQETDHISIVNNYKSFLLETEGVGDVTVSASYNWHSTDAEA
jgi:hypothetical protein